MSRIWYSYVGEVSAANYLPIDLKPTCFEDSFNICAIYVRTNPNYGLPPMPFSSYLVRYIASAKATGLAQPVGMAVKKYIYTFPGL